MGSRREFIRGAAALPVLAFAAREATAKTQVLKGSVTYRERMALPAGAVVTVQLVDVSLADAPSVTLAEVRIAPDLQVPVPFELSYDDAAVVANHSYSLQARIDAEGQLLFITKTHFPVLTGGRDETELLVERVASSEEPPQGRWFAEDILGGGVVDNAETVLAIGADGQVAGSGGCNRISGKAKIMGDGIQFGPIAATRMACVPAVGDQEQKFFKALGLARSWQYQPDGDKLVLMGKGGEALMVLARRR